MPFSGKMERSCAIEPSLQVNHSLGLTFYCSNMPLKLHVAPLVASAVVTAALALSAGGCSNIGPRETTGSITDTSTTPGGQAEWRRSLDTLGARYRDNPNDVDAAIAYAHALRA